MNIITDRKKSKTHRKQATDTPKLCN